MKLIFKIFLSFVLVQSIATHAFAQPKKITYRNRLADSVKLVNTQEVEPRVKGPKPLTKEHAIGARINTDGWGLYFNYGLIKKTKAVKQKLIVFTMCSTSRSKWASVITPRSFVILQQYVRNLTVIIS